MNVKEALGTLSNLSLPLQWVEEKKKKEPDISRFQIENVNAVKGEEEEEKKSQLDLTLSIKKSYVTQIHLDRVLVSNYSEFSETFSQI
ncbi:hypothetical protein DERP_013975 [Dermatophagoides pteronyssinus]|uniref:Uncharacterized protein n=1 Tax=Dermatophagoides pteronyssinus TaxID=6956 RepID=A0ABQ8IRT7_DERPT|nr:hypothetical protein DERP_013975 [Dermatophagoides pteronyssinus]